MNSTCKVVFDKIRGGLMSVNDVTSSVRARGMKTVVASTVAFLIASVTGAMEPCRA